MIMIPASVVYFTLGFVSGIVSFIVFMVLLNNRINKKKEQQLNEFKSFFDNNDVDEK